MYTCHTKEFAKRALDLKLNELNEFKEELELTCCDTEEIKPVKGDQKKDINLRLMEPLSFMITC